MTEIKSRKKILDKISEVRNILYELGRLEDVLKFEEVSELAKDEVEKSAWKLMNKLNKSASEAKDYELTN